MAKGDSQETAFFRGAGGAVFEMALPLPENMVNQMARGELVRVNADGSQVDQAPEDDKPPALSAAKPEWVGWAVKASAKAGKPITIDDADAMTKNDLVEKYGK